MPSNIPVNIPADGDPINNASLRGAFQTIRTEVEHGGFGRQGATGTADRRTRDKLNVELPSVKDYGAVGDGTMHTVAEWLVGGARSRGFANLAAIQVAYPHVRALTDSADWAAIQQAITSPSDTAETGGLVPWKSRRDQLARAAIVPPGHYILNRTVYFKASVDQPFNGAQHGGGTFSQSMNSTGPRLLGMNTGSCVLEWLAVDTVWTGHENLDNGWGFGIKWVGSPHATTRGGLMGHSEISNLTLIGPNRFPSSNHVGVQIGSYSHFLMERVHITHWGQTGLELLRKYYVVGGDTMPIDGSTYNLTDDRSTHACLINVMVDNVGNPTYTNNETTTHYEGRCVQIGAPDRWVEVIGPHDSRGFECDHVVSILGEYVGARYGMECWAQQYTGVGNLYSGYYAGTRFYSGRTDKMLSGNITCQGDRWENSPRLANCLIENVRTYALINCTAVNGDPDGGPGTEGGRPSPAVWVGRSSNTGSRGVIIGMQVDGRTRTDDIFRFGESSASGSQVRCSIIDPYIENLETGGRAVQIVKVLNTGGSSDIVVTLHQNGAITRYDSRKDYPKVTRVATTDVKRTAPPDTGTWSRGDIVPNYSNAENAVPGWVCTRSGTLKTWADANVAVAEMATSSSIIRFNNLTQPLPFEAGEFLQTNEGGPGVINLPVLIERIPSEEFGIGKVFAQSLGGTSTTVLQLTAERDDVDPIADLATGQGLRFAGVANHPNGGWRIASVDRGARRVNLFYPLPAPIGSPVEMTRQPCVHVDAANIVTPMTSGRVNYAQPMFEPLRSPGMAVTTGAVLDAAGSELVRVTNTAPTTLTGINNTTEARHFMLLFADANTTVPQGAIFKLKAGINFVSAANQTLSLVRYQGVFYEV